MKTAEKIGLISFVTLSLLAIPAVASAVSAAISAPPSDIGTLGDELVMAIPEDDSPCTDTRLLIWGAAPLKKFAIQLGASLLQSQALPAELRAAVLQQNPKRLYLFGHGLADVYSCDECQYFLTSSGLNLDLVAGRYVHLCSCLTAEDLGQKIISSGAIAYFGYYQEFMFTSLASPGSGRFVEAAFYGDMQIESLMHDGTMDLQALYTGAIKRYNDEIAYWQENWMNESCDGQPISEADAQLLITVLVHNRDTLRCYYTGGQYPQE